MGKLPTITRLITEDVPTEHRDWFDRILVVLNTFISTTLSLFNKGLNFQDNFDAMVHTVEFSGRDFSEATGTPITIRSTLKGVPKGVIKLQLEDITADGTSTLASNTSYDLQWKFDNSGKIKITDIQNITSNNSASTYRMTLLVI